MKDFKIWMNGKLVTQAEAVLPVNSAAVFYATNVFEGIRAYWNEAEGELYCFRLAEHFARFRESMKMMRFTVPYQDLDLYDAVRDMLRGNEVREDVHMHLVGYVAGPGLDATSPSGLYINPRRRARVEGGNGLKACHAPGQGRRLRLPHLPEPARHGGRGHGGDLLHGSPGQARDAACDQRHSRVDHADHPDRIARSQPGDGRGRAGDRADRALRG